VRYSRRITKCLGTAGLVLLLLGQACCQATPADPEADVLETARQAFLSGQYIRAEDTYQYYLQMYPNGRFRLEAWQRLTDISQDGHDAPGEAATLLEAALLEFGSDPDIAPDLLSRSAQLRVRRKEYDVAVASYQAILSFPGISDKKRLDAYLQLAHVRMLTGDIPAALAVLQTCRQSDLPVTESVVCAYTQAETLIGLDKGREAEPILQEIFSDAKNSATLRGQAGFSLGLMYEAKKDKAAAKTCYENVLSLHPNPLVVKKRLEFLSK